MVFISLAVDVYVAKLLKILYCLMSKSLSKFLYDLFC